MRLTKGLMRLTNQDVVLILLVKSVYFWMLLFHSYLQFHAFLDVYLLL